MAMLTKNEYVLEESKKASNFCKKRDKVPVSLKAMAGYWITETNELF